MARIIKTDTATGARRRFPAMDRRPQGTRESDAPDLLDKTIAVWQPRAKRTLTREDAREIVSNMMGFFAVLDEWDRAERLKAGSPPEPERPVAPSIRGGKRKRSPKLDQRRDAIGEPHDPA